MTNFCLWISSRDTGYHQLHSFSVWKNLKSEAVMKRLEIRKNRNYRTGEPLSGRGS